MIFVEQIVYTVQEREKINKESNSNKQETKYELLGWAC
jgi:hypothetical protein